MHVFEKEHTNEHLLKLILDEDELSWQHIIHDLVRSEQMDPWDVDIKAITAQFLKIIRKLTELDFRVSGKMVLASAMLLKIKSKQLMEEDFTALDTLINTVEEPEMMDEFFGFEDEFFKEDTEPVKQPKIYPRTPQPRQRKVSVYDLVDALEHALDVRVRKEQRALDKVQIQHTQVTIPENSIDVSSLMNTLLVRIDEHFQSAEELMFSHLVPSGNKMDKVLTFIPLLHLTNELRVDLHQEETFSEIHIHLLDNSPIEYSEQEVASPVPL
jgi:segregation and condensation protein A